MTDVTLLDRPTWQEVVLSFAPAQRRSERVHAALARVPLALILLMQGLLTWRLSDIASNDEALYIEVGHAMIRHLLHGTATPAYGSYLSGAPAAYPVPAALLDAVGGLTLVRMFSLLCVLSATVCVYKSVEHLCGHRAGLFGAAAFALAGSVQYVGKLATFDAPCVALLALALMLAVRGRSLVSAGEIGVLLAFAAATKFVAASFAPVVLAILFAAQAGTRRECARAALSSAVAAGTCALLLLGGYRLWGASIATGIHVTTSGRTASNWQPFGLLASSVVRDVGLLGLVALAGLLIAFNRRSYRFATIAGLCLLGSALVPLAQIRIHEFTSLDKHTYLSALFLAVPAGFALDWAFRRTILYKLAVCGLLWLLLVDGMWRSEFQYSWPRSVPQTIAALEMHDVPGTYLSLDGDSESLYTPTNSGITWTSTATAYSLYAQGGAIVNAVLSGRYSGFVYETGDVTSSQGATQDQMAKALRGDPAYRLVATMRVGPYTDAKWYVWQKLSGQVEAHLAAATSVTR